MGEGEKSMRRSRAVEVETGYGTGYEAGEVRKGAGQGLKNELQGLSSSVWSKKENDNAGVDLYFESSFY